MKNLSTPMCNPRAPILPALDQADIHIW